MSLEFSIMLLVRLQHLYMCQLHRNVFVCLNEFQALYEIFQKRRSAACLELKFRGLQDELQTMVSVKIVMIHQKTSTNSIWKICYEKILRG